MDYEEKDRLIAYDVVLTIAVIAENESDAKNQLDWLLEQLDDDITPFNIKFVEQGEYL